MNQLDLTGRIAVITGGGSGMGAASALRLARAGAEVVIADLDLGRAEGVVREIEQEGGTASAIQVNLLDESSVDAFVEAVSASHDRVDVLFNNAGGPGPQGLDFDYVSWERSMKLNVWVPSVITQRLLPLLKASGKASIIYTASTSGLVASPNSPTYAAAKGAVVMLAKSVAVLLAPDGIRANAICPGVTETPMLSRFYGSEERTESVQARIDTYLSSVPLGRVAQPEEIAGAVLFLASDLSSYLTGAAIPVDGGLVAK